MNTPVALRAGDRVLVTRLNYLGDVVISLSMVDALRRAHPGVEIDYLTREPAASLLRGDARFGRVLTLRDGASHAFKTILELRARHYRAVIDLYSNPRSAWLSWLSGAPVRIGGNRRGRRWLYTHRIETARGLPVSDVFMQYAKPLGARGPAPKPVLSISAAEGSAAESVLANAGITQSGGPRIGIHPGGKWPVKRWPAPYFAELAEGLRARGMHVVLFTGPDEAGATRETAARMDPPATILDVMPIRETAAVVSRLDALVVCDGGIMHTAVAVGTPTIGIFGSSEPSIWFPYENHGPFRPAFIPIVCRPCHRHECPLGHTNCLNELRPEHVLTLVESLITKGTARIP